MEKSMINIKHRPILDVKKAAEHYSIKDGTAVKYVCTSAIREQAAFAADIFYRETPHPEYGNRYFGLFSNYANEIMISAADTIELLSFDMINVNGEYHYSRHRHDYYTIDDVSIDGGRAYLRLSGNVKYPVSTFRVKDGEFSKVEA
jgi:hypothetical protein